MGFFKRAKDEYHEDPLLDDASWIRAGESRYESLIPNHYGSPDTIATGGDRRAALADTGCALFFYQKAIDTLHSIYVCGFTDTGPGGWSRQPSQRDLTIVDCYLATLEEILSSRPGCRVEHSVREVTHRLRTISSQFKRYGLVADEYLGRLDRLGRTAPTVDVSGVFWS